MKPSNNLIPASPSSGLVAWLEGTRFVLPLKGIEIRFDLRGDLLEVEIDQIYHQSQSQVLEVTYSFPLPAGAAVHHCSMHTEGRVVTGKVLPLHEARRLAGEKKALGHRTALVECVRENLFELNLGNLAPGDTVTVRLAYLQSLDYEGRDAASFRIPLTPGIRYIPGEALLRRNWGAGASDDTGVVPDASRLSPPRIDALHPDAAYISCEGTVDLAGWDAAQVTSPSHALRLEPGTGEEERVQIRLASQGEVPDRDFVVRLGARRGAEVASSAWSTREGGRCYAAIRLVAPPAAPVAEVPRDYYFLIDRSGSMEGVKWRSCAQALREFLRRLGPLDRAWVTFFESEYQDLAEKPLPAAAILAEPAIARLEEYGTRGGTELYPALGHVLKRLDHHAAPERESTLVILTDGQVGDEERIHQLLVPRRGRMRVHTFGIDTAVNEVFLKQLAADHGGACSLATPSDDIPGMVAAISRRMGAAVVRGLRFGADWEAPAEALAALWEGDAVTLAVRGPESARGVLVFGESAEGKEVSWTIPLEPAGSAAPQLLWQRQRIQWLERQGREKEAVTVACAANLLARGTAFLAWDEVLGEVVSGPEAAFYQPSLDPAGWGGMVAAAGEFCMEAPLVGATPFFRKRRSLVRDGVSGLLEAFRKEPAVGDSGLHDVPLLTGASAAAWRQELGPCLELSGAGGVQLIDWLEQWVWLEPDRAGEREQELAELALRLASVRREKRREEFLVWIRGHTEALLRDAVEKLLEAGE